ncbi:SAF domain-containing protein [Alkaliphilus sp. B6464]|uniref:SAF domain-containing protein n=1 Tax=Alkaliphilus sp. B6464 TaxID=2731219 RepID=UPI001BA5C493|nr:RcpC/CpaB family pilus assembly protein [Alkaliphilus sp. B6464]QUH21998.1 hypothetical protein HYG84_19020 [Alkaliphilus sp. B6464]
MNKRLVVASLAALVITVMIISGLIYGVNNMSKPEETIEIAYALQEIKAGSIIKPEMYEYRSIPVDEFNPSYVTKEEVMIPNLDGKKAAQLIDVLKGKEADENIYKGERIVKARIRGIGADKNEEIFENTNLRRMTYTAQGINNLAGQVKSGDRVDFWIRYTLADKINKDKVVVVDKVLANVPILKALDQNSQEIRNGSEAPSTTIEVALTQEQIQEFIKWKGMGSITLVKVPVDADLDKENDITRKKMSMNDLILEVISMTEDEMNKEDIVIDKNKKGEVGNYEIIEDITGGN